MLSRSPPGGRQDRSVSSPGHSRLRCSEAISRQAFARPVSAAVVVCTHAGSRVAIGAGEISLELSEHGELHAQTFGS
jgi:hypothetical protein